ncbi:MAG: hypothetical protein IH820_17330 [Bacteroidetes bacterium]|nr:hypothetical protein [Bacteroidota bacterium]
MKRLVGTVVVVALLLAHVAACSGSKEETEAPVDQPDVTVRVTNDDWLDVTVYVIYKAKRFRLGRVTTGNTEVFVVPEGLIVGATDLQFLGIPLASRDNRITEPIIVSPGDEVTLVNGQRRWTYVGLVPGGY